jgi:hypothetical protein
MFSLDGGIAGTKSITNLNNLTGLNANTKGNLIKGNQMNNFKN